MFKKKLKKIEAKANLGLPISEKEKKFYFAFAKLLDREVLNAPIKE